ncbi:MAG: TadE family protein [Polyangiaceae bacterium]
MSTQTKTLRSDQRGAALPEFAIAVFPLTFLFFGLAQVCEVQIGHILMHHAAIIGARCASVIKGPHLPGLYVSNNDGKSDSGDAEGECTKAATMALGPLSKSFTGIAVIPTYSSADHFGDVDTTVLATYKCGVPLGQHLVCNGDAVNFSFEIKLPHQGADYIIGSGANCGGSCASTSGPGGGVDVPNGSSSGGNNGGSNGGTFQGGGGTFGGGGASGGF